MWTIYANVYVWIRTINISEEIMNIKEFWNKYKTIIIVISSIVAIVVTVYILVERSKNQESDISLIAINSPFEYEDSTVTFTNSPSTLNIPSMLEVYKTTEPSISVAENFAKRFYTGTSLQSSDGNVYVWKFGSSVISYSKDSVLLHLTSPEGLVTDIKINSGTDVVSFLSDYLGVSNIDTLETTVLENGKKEYRGYMKYENILYGSISLEGYAVNLVSDNSKIYSLSILLLTDTYIVTYQNMPTRAISVALVDSHEIYPIYRSYDESYNNQYPILKASSKLKSVNINESSYRYVFSSRNYGYVYPVYEIRGDGALKDSQNNSYWADVVIYLSALDSKYQNKVYPKEVELFDGAQ